MAENLFLRLIGDRLEWLVMSEADKSVRLRGKGTSAEFESLLTDIHFDGQTIVLVPSDRVLMTRATVPSKQLRQIMQAIPFMVEESLAQDVEDCHFAIGKPGGGGVVDVCVVDRSLIRSWLDGLDAISTRPGIMVPDVLAVPFSDGIDVLIIDDRALVRTGVGQGVSVPLSMLPMSLSLSGEVDHINIHLHPAARQSFELQLSQIEADFHGQLNVMALDTEPFEFLCTHLDRGAINLLQGEFRVAQEKTNRESGWRMAAMLAAFAFGLHIMLLLGQGIYLDVKASQYEVEAQALYAAVFPADKNVRDIRRRWQAHLGSASGAGTGEFFELFSEAARRLPGSRLEVHNINFNESRGDLILQMTAPESEQFVVFAQTLTQAGLVAEVGTINQDSDVARGSIKVKMVGDS